MPSNDVVGLQTAPRQLLAQLVAVDLHRNRYRASSSCRYRANSSCDRQCGAHRGVGMSDFSEQVIGALKPLACSLSLSC